MELTTQEKAMAWFNSRGIIASRNDDSVIIDVDGYDIYISTSEIEYRAELFDEENN